MSVTVQNTPLDPWQLLQRHATTLRAGGYGALASFVGYARDFNNGADVQALTLEHYPGMTEKELQRIVDTARTRWHILDALIVHRVGRIEPGEPIVLTAAWAAHRDAAFAACRFLIETLKTDAPFWKKEARADAEQWVTHNT